MTTSKYYAQLELIAIQALFTLATMLHLGYQSDFSDKSAISNYINIAVEKSLFAPQTKF